MNTTPCKICNNTENNKLFTAREMMFGFRDPFEYMECGQCGCLQIREIPENISKYYPKDYYSFEEKKDYNLSKTPFKQKAQLWLKQQLLNYKVGEFNPIGQLLSIKYDNVFPWLDQKMIRKDSSILDVGCGSGKLLQKMRLFGFQNLMGIDPFISEDISYPSGVTVKKKFIYEVEGTFDFIMLHHSFEHMDQPLAIFKEIHRLLNEGGLALIRIPVAACFAWRKYGVNWFQLDAPRHYFLHTQKSIQILAGQSGLQLKKVKYDSNKYQFSRSEKYVRDIPLRERATLFSEKDLLKFEKEAAKLNRLNDGDSACFYLYKDKQVDSKRVQNKMDEKLAF